MGKREIGTMGIIGIILVAMGVGAITYIGYLNGAFAFIGLTPAAIEGKPVVIEGQELARFSVVLDKEDSAGSLVASETAWIWCDWNGDGVMQRDTFGGYSDAGGLVGGEIEPCSSAATTALLTSPSQYPVGHTIWLFVDTGKDAGGRDYQIKYHSLVLQGSKDTSGVIHMGTVYLRATEDALDYAGLVGITSIDDGTDYNATLYGTDATFELRMTFATSDAGFSSSVSSSFYTGSGPWTHWGNGIEYAPTYIGFYMTNQDFIDLGMDTTGFDLVYQGASNTYCAMFITPADEANTFYDSDLTTAPSYSLSFGVSITATGAFTYIGVYQDVKWSNFVLGIWGDTTDNQILGTLGADWDWTVV
jgi:hypothetical protein